MPLVLKFSRSINQYLENWCSQDIKTSICNTLGVRSQFQFGFLIISDCALSLTDFGFNIPWALVLLVRKEHPNYTPMTIDFPSFQAKYQNPDWSFKDRLNPTFKSQEAPLGAKNQRIN